MQSVGTMQTGAQQKQPSIAKSTSSRSIFTRVDPSVTDGYSEIKELDQWAAVQHYNTVAYLEE